MRGERERPPLRGAYWLLAAIYLIASLGHALASGNGPAVALALCAPAGIVLFPCIVAEGASVATESVVDQLWELEHSEDSVATALDAWGLTVGRSAHLREAPRIVDRRSGHHHPPPPRRTPQEK